MIALYIAAQVDHVSLDMSKTDKICRGQRWPPPSMTCLCTRQRAEATLPWCSGPSAGRPRVVVNKGAQGEGHADVTRTRRESSPSRRLSCAQGGGMSPLFIAAETGHTSVMRPPLPPLSMAAFSGQTRIV